MTLEPPVWLVRLPEDAERAITTSLTTQGLSVVRVESLNEAIMRLGESTPQLAIADGLFGHTERLKLYAALQARSGGGEIPLITVNPDDASSLEVIGGEGAAGDARHSAAAISDMVRSALWVATREPGPATDPPIGDMTMPESLRPSALPLHVDVVSTPAPPANHARPDAVAPSAAAEESARPVITGDAGTPRLVTHLSEREPNAIEQILGALARRWWLALAALAMVMAADVFYTATREKTYLARASLIISPSANVDRGSLVYSVDSLGRGRIVGTYAEVLGSDLVHREALERLGLPATALNATVTFKSSTVADTAVVQVTAESPDPELSAMAANYAGEVGIERMTGLFPVYNLVFLSRATAPLTPYRPDPIRNYSIGLLVGLILATVVAYAADTAARSSAARLADIPVKPKERATKSVPTPNRPPKAETPKVSDKPKRSWFGRAQKPTPVVASTEAAPTWMHAAPVPVPGVPAAPTASPVSAPVTIAPEPAVAKRSLFRGLFKGRSKAEANEANPSPRAAAKSPPAPAVVLKSAPDVSLDPAPAPKVKSVKGGSFLGKFFKPREPGQSARQRKDAAAAETREAAATRLERVITATHPGSPESADAADKPQPFDRGASAVA